VGRSFFEEDTFATSPRRIENLFGSEFTYREGSTPWLLPATADHDEFERVLDMAEKTKMRAWCFPQEFLREWDVRQRDGRDLPSLGTGSRGPATIMTTVLKPETAILWMIDRPALMLRFSEVLANKTVELNLILREFSQNKCSDWWITDDNSALLNPELYDKYCMPVLEKVLAQLAPGDSVRHQHSDSAMGHLLDRQASLGINSVNYGPEVDVALIRKRMPDATIFGHLPPLLLRNGSPLQIRDRVVADFAKAGSTGGLNVTTAGSLAGGTGVGRMRWLMLVVQEWCRYDRGENALCRN
jgi:uroporphyrinogen decarboxylase